MTSSSSLRKPYISGQNIGKFSCTRCPYRATRKRNVWRHESFHNDLLEFQCFYCTFSSNNASSISRHAKRVHPELKHIKPKANFYSLSLGFSSSHSTLNKFDRYKLAQQATSETKMKLPEIHSADGTAVVDLPLNLSIAKDNAEKRKDKPVMCTATPTMVDPGALMNGNKIKATEEAVNGETGRIQMDHVQNTDELRKEIKGLEKKNRALSARKATYIDLKRQLADLKTQKMQLEEELSILKQGPFIKKLNKLQPHSSSNSSTASLLSSLEIQQKETLLANVEMKISLFMKKNVNLHARIDWVRSKLGENVHNLTKMRALLDSL